jgi:hypothetical protein
MPPIDTDDDPIDYRKVRELSEEFTQLWKRLQAFYLDAVAGFNLIRNHVEKDQEQMRAFLRGTELDSEAFQDSMIFTYANIFEDANFCTAGIHQATLGEAKERNAASGGNFTILGQVCIVSFYDFWNEYLRREFVIAIGQVDRNEQNQKIVQQRLRKHASHDLWGDLRYLRTSIVHHLGVATDEVTRCKLIKWFKPGDDISLTPEHIRAIFLALLKYRNQLFEVSMPKQRFYITEYYRTES